ncbi:MAG: hypothetical protein ACRDZZ_11985 [Ilumatobacteraceae bacterium]
MRTRSVAITAVVAITLAAVGSARPAAAHGQKGGPAVIKVGAASRSVLPTVGGTHDYLADVEPDPGDPFSPGLFVPAWDQGRVAVGNGDSVSHWVHDDMRVSAVAFKEQQSKDITVVVASNLYMIFGTDGAVIRERVAELVGPKVAEHLQIAISADHNHHGPDTAFDVNHEWYDLMIDQAAAAIVEAIDELRPARLSVAETDHYFGLRDSRDPQVADPTLGVLRATATNGRTIATMVFWANHPETTLFWEPPNDTILDDCAQIGLSPCTFEDRYFTADFPGWATRIIEDELGGEALFFNGAVGDLITPLGANVWEVDRQAPLGLGLVPPDGAQPPLGASDFQQRNFRRAYLIGRELAKAALRTLRSAEPVPRPTVDYDVETMYTRMSNIGFRLLLVRGPDGNTALGHTPAMLHTCPAMGPKNDQTCAPDQFATIGDDLLGEIRAGDHARTNVAYLRIGPVGMMWLPAEVGPESTIGMPAGYVETPTNWHADDIGLHASGADYLTSGYVKNRMPDRYRWIVGLGNDELGYAVPLSDYRVRCVADQLAGPGTCAALFGAGAIEYPDAVAGTTCKAVTEDPSLLANYGAAAEAIAASCKYGQALGEANDHYEETNSAGWDLEADILAAVARLTGDDDATVVNSRFPGWWMGYTPPG